jgi:hypothetical protein
MVISHHNFGQLPIEIAVLSVTQYLMEIFLAYSYKDKALRDELVTHLQPLHREKIITSWTERIVFPGVEWKNEIDSHVESANIILLPN